MKTLYKKILLMSGLFLIHGASFSQTTFNYTGSVQNYTVPAGVTEIQIEVWGAQGENQTVGTTQSGGLGGYAIGNLTVTPGEVLSIAVGGQDGYNGGGAGGLQGNANTINGPDAGFGPSGGGASDVRQGGTALTDRIIVAGGGGGAGNDGSWNSCLPAIGTDGGAGGGLIGTNGVTSTLSVACNCNGGGGEGGQGGTQAAGGAAGNYQGGCLVSSSWAIGQAGSLGQGGNGDTSAPYAGDGAAGGGGGGYYGGGAGGDGVNTTSAGGGGGGSSYIGGVTSGSTTAGLQTGDGVVVITVLCSPTTITPDLASLLDVTADCSATPTAPTATNDCGFQMTGTPDVSFPIATQGTTVVTWTYNDSVNTSTQTQNVIIADVTDPIPNQATLPDVNGVQCQVDSLPIPEATDSCAGIIIGTTTTQFPITSPGTTIVTWTYDDGNGNVATQQQSVINPTLDNTVTQTGTTLEANQATATYQWLDCDNSFSDIVGEVNQSFTPAVTGNYAVEISLSGCLDTSTCTLIDYTSVDELMLSGDKELVMILDFTGRETQYRPNTPLIFVYSDGTRQRVMKLEK